MEQNNITHKQERFNDQSLPEERENIHVEDLQNIRIYYAEKVDERGKYPLKEQSLKALIDAIRSDEVLKNKIEAIRAIKGEDEEKAKKARTALKKSTLSYFTFGEFKGNRAKNKNLIRIKYMIFDPDVIDDLETTRQAVISDPNTFICFNSPSGKGLKVGWALDTEITDPFLYKKIYTHYLGVFKKRFSVNADPTNDPARACFISYDPNVFVNTNCLPVPVNIPIFSSTSGEFKEKKVPVFTAALKGGEPGERTHNLTRVIGAYLRKGIEVEKIIENVLKLNQNNKPPLPEDKVRETVKYMSENYKNLLIQFTENRGCYEKYSQKGPTTVTTFTIDPKELLVLPDGDCLRCDVTSSQGHTYKDIFIENTDWHSKAKLLKAIGHQDCAFVGVDQHVQALCYYINAQVDVRKTGTKVIGLHDDTWVVKGRNITANEDQTNPTIIPYDKGADAFLNRITYGSISGEEQKAFLKSFYCDIFSINDHKVIAPVIGWSFAAPMKPIIMKLTGSFPLLFMHGGQGSGKTTTAKLILRINGYRDPEPNRCSMKPFPMLKLLSSANAIPIMLDEFKVSDLKQDTVDNILRTMRQTYTGELESKGRPDQTVQDYKLQAPLAVIGEWSINQPAIKERIIFARFSDVIKKDETMQLAFSRIRDLPLEAFMPGYVSFCLGQDTKLLYEESAAAVREHFKGRTIAPRIIHNLSVMVLGLTLFERYGTFNGLDVPQIDMNAVLDAQLEEITGNKTGFVLSAVDQLINELSVYAQKNVLLSLGETWHKIAVVQRKYVIAIRFNQIFPLFKEYAHRTRYEGDLLDKESYMKLFDECDYVVDKQHGVKFDQKLYRSLCIDVEKAKVAGIDLEGFTTVCVDPEKARADGSGIAA